MCVCVCVTCQAPLSLEFSRQEYWSGLPFPSPEESCGMYLIVATCSKGFPDSSVGKESTYNAGDPGFIPGSRRSAGEGIGYPLQYSLFFIFFLFFLLVGG